ncbi:hypothetical protein [Hymenobacter radiodurans]|uniref:hypothetical protein n=1 Tax=Hymenobacter radiodurans TaxID=2496028 RepID=UPI001058E8C9|nr:hypothetical protein [Hymenobacter radiodurans]
MAVYITLKENIEPEVLLRLIKEKIEDKSIKTWECATTPEYTFMHTPGEPGDQQWNEGARLQVDSIVKPLKLYYKLRPNAEVRKGTYGVLNGRFVELLFNHFSHLIDAVQVVDLRNK